MMFIYSELKDLIKTIPEDMVSIYCYENKVSGKVYIGQTINILDRHSRHVRSNEKGFDQAINKYGENNFNLFIIEIVENIEQADASEIFWIAEMRKMLGKNNVYNIANGGRRGAIGIKQSEETCKKKSENMKGEKNHMFGKKGELSPVFGVPCSDERKRKIGDAQRGEKNHNFGKIFSEEAIKNMSKAHSGENHYLFGKSMPEKTKKILSDLNYGEKNPRSKLTKNDVIKIKEIIKEGIVDLDEVASKFNISRCTINDIKAGRTWKKTG